MFEKFSDFMQGEKTFLVLVALAVVLGLDVRDVIADESALSLYAILAPLGGATFAAKVNRGIEILRSIDLKSK